MLRIGIKELNEDGSDLFDYSICIFAERWNVLEAFDQSESCTFSYIGTRITCAFLHCEVDNASDHGHLGSNATQHSESHGANEWIWVRKILLERVYGQKGEVWFKMCMAKKVYINQLADLQRLRSHVLDYEGKERRDGNISGDHLLGYG